MTHSKGINQVQFDNCTECYISPVTFGPLPCELQSPAGKPYTGVLSKVEQYVMAYRVDQEQVRNLLPEGFRSLRPVLRINVELLHDVAWLGGKSFNRIEFNTPVECCGKKGWFNLITWEDDPDSIICGRDLLGIPKLFAQITVEKTAKETKIAAKSRDFTFLEMVFEKSGKEGGCPKEDDNEGTFHLRYVPKIGSKTSKAELLQTAFTPVEIIDQGKEYCNCTFQWHSPDFQDMPFGYKALQQIQSIENKMVLGAYVVYFDRINGYGEQEIL